MGDERAEDIEGMQLGELVEKMIFIAIKTARRLDALDGKGSQYGSEESIKEMISKEGQGELQPYKEELARREKVYFEQSSSFKPYHTTRFLKKK